MKRLFVLFGVFLLLVAVVHANHWNAHYQTHDALTPYPYTTYAQSYRTPSYYPEYQEPVYVRSDYGTRWQPSGNIGLTTSRYYSNNNRHYSMGYYFSPW
ncbi:hypothetical protein J4457_05785 [Candidatus Woesearchaeota archaeon]|nr:hypothetical protein [Candidatus Woesearchaeota archaeon]